MPRNKTTRICGANDMPCCNSAYYDTIEKKLEEEIKGRGQSQTGAKIKRMCDCLPSCNSLEYDAGVTDILFNWKDHMIATREPVEHLKK